VAGECLLVQCGQHGREILLAVAEIVLQVVTLGLQGVETFVLDLTIPVKLSAVIPLCVAIGLSTTPFSPAFASAPMFMLKYRLE
jgi:hypothetical protein